MGRQCALMTGASTTTYIYLRAWRKHRGLTLSQVADLIGSKTNTLSNWETGGRSVDLDDLKKLADAYGVHPAALLFSPHDSTEFEGLRAASELLRRMGPEAAKAWLDIGDRLAIQILPEK